MTKAITNAKTAAARTKVYTFDVKLFAQVSIEATSESEAQRKIEMLGSQCAQVKFEPLEGERAVRADASVDGDSDLIEINGEPLP